MSCTSQAGAAQAELIHDARAAANAIIGRSALLAEGIYGPLTEEQQAQVESIRDSGLRLVATLNALTLDA
jgi:signal transduction histidine kinase